MYEYGQGVLISYAKKSESILQILEVFFLSLNKSIPVKEKEEGGFFKAFGC